MNAGEPLAAEALQHAIPGAAEKSEETSINEKSNESPVVSAEDPQYPKGVKLLTITASLMLAVFCVALDNTVSILPRIPFAFGDSQLTYNKDHCHSHTEDHQRIYGPERRRLVCVVLPPHHLR